MKQFWDLPWWQRFVFDAGQWSEQWKFVNWRIAIVFYGVMDFVAVGASFEYWPAAAMAAVFLFFAWVSWHYGRHMKGKIER